jgi:hypothetical protein
MLVVINYNVGLQIIGILAFRDTESHILPASHHEQRLANEDMQDLARLPLT